MNISQGCICRDSYNAHAFSETSATTVNDVPVHTKTLAQGYIASTDSEAKPTTSKIFQYSEGPYTSGHYSQDSLDDLSGYPAINICNTLSSSVTGVVNDWDEAGNMISILWHQYECTGKWRVGDSDVVACSRRYIAIHSSNSGRKTDGVQRKPA